MFFHSRNNCVLKKMDEPIDSDVIYGPLDESEEAVAAVNELAEKNDDPDMQVNVRSSGLFSFSIDEI